MAQDAGQLVLVNAKAKAWLETQTEVPLRSGTWVDTTALGDLTEHAAGWKTTLVDWEVESVTDSIRIAAALAGRQLRTLEYVDSTWSSRGKPLPSEDRKAVAAWRKRDDVLAIPHGYEVLEALVGGPWETIAARTVKIEGAIPAPVDESQPLARAAFGQDWEAVKTILSRRPLHSEVRSMSLALLFEFAKLGEVEKVRGLLDGGVDPGRGDRAATPLHVTRSSHVAVAAFHLRK